MWWTLDARNDLAEMLIRGDRRAGEILAGMEFDKGALGNPGGRGAKVVRSPDGTTQRLADLGLLAAGVVALIQKQPYPVYYPLLLTGLTSALLFTLLLPTVCR